MQYYPPELATPPLALVALLGCPELHSTVGEFLRSTHRPPINSIGVGNPTSASRLFGTMSCQLDIASNPAMQGVFNKLFHYMPLQESARVHPTCSPNPKTS